MGTLILRLSQGTAIYGNDSLESYMNWERDAINLKASKFYVCVEDKEIKDTFNKK